MERDTISGLYSQDISQDAIFVLEYPTSHSERLSDDRFFVNQARFLIDDEYKLPTYETYSHQIPFRYLAAFGDKARVYVREKPDSQLVDHWGRQLDFYEDIRYASFGENSPHVVLFPLEALDEKLHAVNAKSHYKVHSKAFIATVDCPQAATQRSLRVPAVLKACRAAGGEGTWTINTPNEYAARRSWVKTHMPHAELLLTDHVQNVAVEYCCHVYINKKGHVTWIAANEKLFDAEGFWCGSTTDMDQQDAIEKMCLPAMTPMVHALHDNDYFGWCGMDILRDERGRLYIVDVNPRLCASSGVLLALRAMARHGLSCALFKGGFRSRKSLGEVLKAAERMKEGRAVVFAAYIKEGVTHVMTAFYARSKNDCLNMATRFERSNELQD